MMKTPLRAICFGRWTGVMVAMMTLTSACKQAAIDHKTIGMNYLDRHMLDSAEWHLSQHVNLHPKDFEARYELGSVLESLGRMDEAKKEVIRLVEAQDANCTIRRKSAFACGRILEYQPQLDSSLHYYYRAYHLNEKCPQDEKEASFIYLLITQVHQKAGNFEAALIAVDSAIVLGTPLGKAASIKGGLLAQLNRFAAADSVFQMGLAASVHDSSAQQSIYSAMAGVAHNRAYSESGKWLDRINKELGQPVDTTRLNADRK
jgi:tetratricopeptide (TPR) repeat protein